MQNAPASEIAPLDPANLTPAASLNRMPISAKVDIGLPAEESGKLAGDLLSAQAVAELIRAEAGSALAAQGVADADLPALFDRRFASIPAAEHIAYRVGQRLAALILTLKSGDDASRAARPDWDGSYWDRWAEIEHIVLGGGLVGGNLGRSVAKYAAFILSRVGSANMKLEVAAHPTQLPLIGVARQVPAGNDSAVVFDFGGTSVKLALAQYRDGALTSLSLLPSQPSPRLGSGASNILHVIAVAEQMAVIMAQTWQQQSAAPANTVVASIASYIANGQPLPRQGAVYTALRDISPKLEVWLAERLYKLLGENIEVKLVHDGTAAAQVYAGTPVGAVIMLGTALGVGYPHAAAVLRPLAVDFRVVL